MKIFVVAGARPNFVKVAPILEAMRGRRDVEPVLVHTGQHYDIRMSGSFFDELGIPAPDINLEVGSGSHAKQTARIMTAFEDVCAREKPDWVTVVGDVNSTVACALTAKKMGIQVAHVEAGLRSWDRSMPEEINRLCTDAISDLLFTTDEGASANLRAEGIEENKIHFVGNTMIDTLLRHVDRAKALPLPDGLQRGEFAVLTLHRPSNVDSGARLQGIFDALEDVAARMPVVFPVHPRTAERLAGIRLHRNVRTTEPMGYLRFVGLIAQARMVLTDSGGIQEETTVLGVPCVTMRANTERPITCEVGTNVLAGTDPRGIRGAAMAALRGEGRAGRIPEKWDGKAAGKIVDVILRTVQSGTHGEHHDKRQALAAAGGQAR